MWLPSGYEARTELEVRRSRFLTLLARTDTEEAARAVIAAARQRHPDARHHCTAFIVEVPGAQAIARSSDDGEPAGTAGMPMLDALRGGGLTNVTAVVTRWFGGTKLGTGGLVRAYGDSVARALDAAPRVSPMQRSLHTLTLVHAEAGRVRSEVEARGAEVVAAAYGDHATLTLSHTDDAALAAAVATVTHGRGMLVPAGTRVVEIPVTNPRVEPRRPMR